MARLVIGLLVFWLAGWFCCSEQPAIAAAISNDVIAFVTGGWLDEGCRLTNGRLWRNKGVTVVSSSDESEEGAVSGSFRICWALYEIEKEKN